MFIKLSVQGDILARDTPTVFWSTPLISNNIKANKSYLCSIVMHLYTQIVKRIKLLIRDISVIYFFSLAQ